MVTDVDRAAAVVRDRDNTAVDVRDRLLHFKGNVPERTSGSVHAVHAVPVIEDDIAPEAEKLRAVLHVQRDRIRKGAFRIDRRLLLYPDPGVDRAGNREHNDDAQGDQGLLAAGLRLPGRFARGPALPDPGKEIAEGVLFGFLPVRPEIKIPVIGLVIGLFRRIVIRGTIRSPRSVIILAVGLNRAVILCVCRLVHSSGVVPVIVRGAIAEIIVVSSAVSPVILRVRSRGFVVGIIGIPVLRIRPVLSSIVREPEFYYCHRVCSVCGSEIQRFSKPGNLCLVSHRTAERYLISQRTVKI